ncbi:MAG: PQQ-binding-like beta-propeller repeat protein, partial [Planctomycetota bacterium]|nr:PQQ-binding-like beta-propeller repeat protein [Planctomycetota bacterium]
WLPQHRNWLAFTGCLLGFAYSLFFRYEGMWGDYTVRLAPRWHPTSETLLLNRGTSNQEVLPVEQRLQSIEQVSWSGFRGNERRGITNTADLETDWLKHPPQEQWRIEIGPGWSSFAVAGDLLFTQEQRGDDECVTCYDAKSGKEIWIHKDQTRLNDPLGGPGPRATPTLHNGRLYTLGSTGIFLCLDPVNGEILWQVNIPKDVGREVPMWGFCASPLPIGDQLIIHASDSSEQDVFAYRASNGELLWTSSAGEHSYSSPQKMNLDDKQYVAILTDEGLAILAPGNGEVVLNYTWPHRGYRALQPCFIGNNQVLLPTGMGTGTRLIQIDKVADNWNVQEVWTTKNLKPDFNDLLVHQGKIFGFDDSIFTCIDLETGERKWKRGRYGKGQSLLLAEDNLVMVLTEQGAVVVLDADSQTHKELASMQMLNGKTWNHPVFIGDRLYLRNSKEAACYVLPKKDRP